MRLKEPAMSHICEEAEKQQASISRQTTSLFQHADPIITDRNEARRLVSRFTDMSENAIAEFTTEMESLINHEIKDTGETILNQYLEVLRKIDDDAAQGKELNFSTRDLIMGSLKGMKENAKTWCAETFATEQIEEYGSATTETKVYYVKTGQREEMVPTERRVKVGSHKTKVGTKKVENPRAKGFLGFFRRVFGGEAKYNDETIYGEVPDYENRISFKKVMKDVYEEHTETVEKYSVKTSDLQAALVSLLRKNLADGIKQMTNYAAEQIDDIVQQFNGYFEELDALIKEKYAELEEVTRDEASRKKNISKNREMLEWMLNIHDKLDHLLEI